MKLWDVVMVALGALVLYGVVEKAFLSLPTVYERYPSGEIVCALDADGNRIPFESIKGRYHHKYASGCPSAGK